MRAGIIPPQNWSGDDVKTQKIYLKEGKRMMKENKTANRNVWLGMLAMALVFGMVLVGCVSTPKVPKEWAVASAPKLEESLRKYMVPQPQTWDNNGVKDKQDTLVYFLDPLHFEEFRSELDAGGEYLQSDNWTEDKRGWDQGRTFVRFAVRPDGRFELNLCNSDNSVIGYRYIKAPQAEGLKLYESLRKYMVPQEQIWDNNGVKDAQYTYVYFLDPLQFEEFKAELDAGGEYAQVESRTQENRGWEQGKTFVRWSARPDGTFQLELCKDDNSINRYNYKKAPQVGDTWDEQWDEGKITLTYLGIENPGLDLRRTGNGRGEYEGYYTFYYQKGVEGHHKCYVYYPTTGREGVQYGKWLD
jgi:hypothetical protein